MSPQDRSNAAALHEIALSLRALVERGVVNEKAIERVEAQIAQLTKALETQAVNVGLLTSEHRERENVARARAAIHQEDEARRRALHGAVEPALNLLRSPWGVALTVALLAALASKLGVSLPVSWAPPPSVINEATGSNLVIRGSRRGGR
jgi:hypothetical protein